jgi:beta-lactam-binding protein with PASTA domain
VVVHDSQPAKTQPPTTVTSGAVALQCVASMAGTLVGETFGSTLPAKLAAGALGALIGAFLTAPGRHRRRRIVAVAIVLALLDALRRAAGALASERRQEPRAWVPANWAVVGLTAAVGFAGGSAVTTVRGAWADEQALVAVPQVRGEPRAAALGILADAGLGASVTTEPSEPIPQGSATRTDPPVGATVGEDAEITLYVSSGPPGETIAIPDVTGQARSAALAVLGDAGLQPRARAEPSRSIAPGHATRTDPPAGTRVNRDAAVTLLVSSGPPSEAVEIPDVRGQPRADALAALRAARLRPRTVTEDSQDIAEGSATRTDPEAGTEVDAGAAVTLFVSSGPAAGQVEVPDVAGSAREEAYVILQDTGLEPEGRTEPSEAIAAGTVVRTDPVAGSLVDAGSTITVIVSSGPQPLVVPDVAGLRSAIAAERLSDVGLASRRSIEGSATVPDDTVIGTDPTAGTEVQKGDTVTLRVSCGADVCVD